MGKELFLLLIAFFLLFSIYSINKTKIDCQRLDYKDCLKDDDCMCSTDPCFFGTKEYYQKCFLPEQKEIVKACPDACGFGPYEIEVKPVCENNQCKLATFNRTTGQTVDSITHT